jgi:hypothetical protein
LCDGDIRVTSDYFIPLAEKNRLDYAAYRRGKSGVRDATRSTCFHRFHIPLNEENGLRKRVQAKEEGPLFPEVAYAGFFL